MNRPFKPVAPAAGSVTPLVEPAATFSYRTTDCEPCGGFGYGYVTPKCEECEGRGEVDAACADCSRVAPLNDDGLCRYCHDSGELSTVEFHMKWLCHGILRNPNGRVEL